MPRLKEASRKGLPWRPHGPYRCGRPSRLRSANHEHDRGPHQRVLVAGQLVVHLQQLRKDMPHPGALVVGVTLAVHHRRARDACADSQDAGRVVVRRVAASFVRRAVRGKGGHQRADQRQRCGGEPDPLLGVGRDVSQGGGSTSRGAWHCPCARTTKRTSRPSSST